MSFKVYEQGYTETKLKKPSMYNVVMHNDDYTPMDFVTALLIKIFKKNPCEAEKLMLNIHNSGRGIAGTYPKDIALSKKTAADEISKANEFPLLLTIEEKEE